MPKFLILMTETDHDARWAAADSAAQDKILTAMGTFATAVRTHGTLHAVLPLIPTVPPNDTTTNLTELLPYPCEIREVMDVGIPITA